MPVQYGTSNNLGIPSWGRVAVSKLQWVYANSSSNIATPWQIKVADRLLFCASILGREGDVKLADLPKKSCLVDSQLLCGLEPIPAVSSKDVEN